MEPDVTVLTGPNDAGKSSLFKLLWRTFTIGAGAPEQPEFNFDAEHDIGHEWQVREDFRATARVVLSDDEIPPDWFGGAEPKPDRFDLPVTLAPQRQGRGISDWFLGDRRLMRGAVGLNHNLFTPVLLPGQSEIRDDVPFDGPTRLEQQLFEVVLLLSGEQPDVIHIS